MDKRNLQLRSQTGSGNKTGKYIKRQGISNPAERIGRRGTHVETLTVFNNHCLKSTGRSIGWNIAERPGRFFTHPASLIREILKQFFHLPVNTQLTNLTNLE